MSYSKYQSDKNPIKHAAKLYGLSNPSSFETDVVKEKVKGGTRITTTKRNPEKTYTPKENQTQTTNPTNYIQDLISKGVTREQAKGEQLVGSHNLHLFPEVKVNKNIEFIPDPVVEKKPEVDYSYLQGLTPTGGYSRDGIMYGQKISSTVGSTLRGGKDPMTREYTQGEMDYLNKTRRGKIASMGDYYDKYPSSKPK